MRYHPAQRVIHWLMAIIILSLLAVGIYMTGLDKEDANRGQLYFLHKSFGVLVLILIALRVALRVKFGTPILPAGINSLERRMAHSTHHFLYLLMVAVPLVGIWMSNSWGYGVSFFGLFDVPFRFPENKEIAPLAGEMHEYLAYGLLALVVLHVAGALKHRFFDKNDVIYRMTWERAPEEKAKD